MTLNIQTDRRLVRAGGHSARYVLVSFAAPESPTASRREPVNVAFVIDRSGSMGGTSIEEVRNALQLCLRSMIPGCAFNIVGFGSKYKMLFKQSRAYDESSLAEASAHVAALEADLGGTEILPALEAVFAQPAHGALTRQVVILTDGEVTNTDAVLALAKEHASDARIFTFGIGAGAGHHLVKGLARAGGGVAEFIYPGERIEPKVVRQFGRLLSPALTNVRVNWSGLDVTQAPSITPPVFSGGRIVVYGLMKSQRRDEKPSTVTLTAEAPGGPMTFAVESITERNDGRVVTTLAAPGASASWRKPAMGEGTRIAAARAKGTSSHADRPAGHPYGLISRETSFVAIEAARRPGRHSAAARSDRVDERMGRHRTHDATRQSPCDGDASGVVVSGYARQAYVGGTRVRGKSQHWGSADGPAAAICA